MRYDARAAEMADLPFVEGHTNTEDYIHEANSPKTNRQNAGILIRRMSDHFDQRRYPGLRRRAQSFSNPAESRWRVASHAVVFVRRLTRSLGGEDGGQLLDDDDES